MPLNCANNNKGLLKLLIGIDLIVVVFIFYTAIYTPKNYEFQPTEISILHDKQWNTKLTLSHSPPTTPVARLTNSRNRYYILVWRTPWGTQPQPDEPEGGKIGICRLTYDRSRLPQALAVLFHHTAFDAPYQLDRPRYRDPDQIYVWYTYSSTARTFHLENNTLEQFGNGFINWTMTYRRDSDVTRSIFDPTTLHDFLRFVQDQSRLDSDYIGRTIRNLKDNNFHMALWLVSNCNLTQGARDRMDYVNQLVSAGLRLDKIGRCYNKDGERSSFTKEQIQKYKFYLAFENSYHCRDYITEKFWMNAIVHFAIPVVWGPAIEDLETLAPRHSYIYVEDFETPADLVNYLNYLNHNDTAYLEYFNWLQQPDMIPPGLTSQVSEYPNDLEDLCFKARRNKEIKIIDDIAKHFYGSEREECMTVRKETFKLKETNPEGNKFPYKIVNKKKKAQVRGLSAKKEKDSQRKRKKKLESS